MRKKYQTASANYKLLQEFALANRNNPTEAERILWEYLKGGFMGEHFRRQHVLLDYIPDFVCLSKKIIIEIDGGYHFEGEQPERDAEREEELAKQGFTILRFTNEEIINDIDKVLETISKTLENLSHNPIGNHLSSLGDGAVVSGNHLSSLGDGAVVSGNHLSSLGDGAVVSGNHLPSLREGSGVGLTIIKVGGAVVEDEAQLTQLLSDFSGIESRKVLVHGGGRKATKMAERLGIETQMVNGRRVTDKDMLEVVTMVYGGLVNKNLVARLQANGINAIGLTGADADIIRSHKRPPVPIDAVDAGLSKLPPSGRAGVGSFSYGFVGDVDAVSGEMLSKLIEADITPVVAPLTHNGEGVILNTNADTIASETAKALARYYDVTLIFAFEKKGVLSNPDDDDSVIPVITEQLFEQYKADGTISGGMLPKIENALAAVRAGVCRVIITRADAIDGRHGTVIE